MVAVQRLNLDLEYEGGRKCRMAGTTDRPEWIAQDVGDLLGLKNVREFLRALDEDEKGAVSIPDAMGRMQDMVTVTEPGLYQLIHRSRKPEAKRFRRWVSHEVLPSIRRYGCYPAPKDGGEMVTVPASVLKAVESLKGQVIHLQNQLDRLAAREAPMLSPATPQFTVRQRMKWHGWSNYPDSSRRAIIKHVKDLLEQFCGGDVPHQAGGTGGGGPLVFSGNQLVYLDEAILSQRRVYELSRISQEARQPTIPFPKTKVDDEAA